ncbi:MAG: cell division protein FtsQ/DivIB [Nitrospiraceae bacterium]
MRVLVLISALGAGTWSAIPLSQDVAPLLQRSFAIREVTIQGLHHVSQQDVRDRLGLRAGATLWSVYLPQLADRLRAIPWIKEATITRIPFHELRVVVVERKPAAVARTTSDNLLVDDEGYILSVMGADDDSTLPALSGLDPKRMLRGEAAVRQAAKAGIELATLMAGTLSGRAEVDAGDPTNLVATMSGLRFQFGSASVEEQWQRFRQVHARLRVAAFDGKTRGPSEIDLRYSGRVIVRERG